MNKHNSSGTSIVIGSNNPDVINHLRSLFGQFGNITIVSSIAEFSEQAAPVRLLCPVIIETRENESELEAWLKAARQNIANPADIEVVPYKPLCYFSLENLLMHISLSIRFSLGLSPAMY